MLQSGMGMCSCSGWGWAQDTEGQEGPSLPAWEHVAVPQEAEVSSPEALPESKQEDLPDTAGPCGGQWAGGL